MTERTMTLDQVQGRKADDLLREIAQGEEIITVVLDEEHTVVLRPAVPLRPLPIMQGMVPEGWKDAIYEP